MIVSNKKGINQTDEMVDRLPVMDGMSAGVRNRNIITFLHLYGCDLPKKTIAPRSNLVDDGHVQFDTPP